MKEEKKDKKVDSKEELPEDKKEDEVESEVVEDINEVENPLQEEVENLKKEVASLKNAYAKAYADTENTKKRLQSEAETNRKYRIQSFATSILPVIDNLERAISASENKEDPLLKGVQMVYDQLIKALEDEGVKEIDCKDKEFDPNFMQSIMVEKKEGVKPNIVIDVLQKGYMLKDRVLRAAMVKISE